MATGVHGVNGQLVQQPVGKESIPEYDNATTPNRIMAANLVLEITSSQDIVIHMIALVIIIFLREQSFDCCGGCLRRV